MAPTKLVRLLPIFQLCWKLGKLTGALGLFKNINMSKQYFGFEQVASAAEGSFFGKKKVASKHPEQSVS